MPLLAALLACATASATTTLTSTLVISGESGSVYSDYAISTTSGPCVTISNSTNVTIQRSAIGPCGDDNTTNDSAGIEITGSSVNIYDSYIHVNNKSSTCSNSHDGIDISYNRLPVYIQGNVIAYSENSISLWDASYVSIIGNFILNPRGSTACPNADNLPGHSIQAWADENTPNTNIVVSGNYLLNSADTGTYTFASNVSDSINFGVTNGITANNNYIVGGNYANGCGLIADYKSSNVGFSGNIISQPYNCGIGLTGSGAYTVSNNKILNLTPSGSSAAGISISGGLCPVNITGNVASSFQGAGPDTSAWNQAFWSSGSCLTPTISGNIFDTGCTLPNCQAYAQLHPMASTNPSPLIPPRPYACTATSPYSTQTSSPACAGTSDTTAPSVPAGLTATLVASSEVDLSWTASTDNVAVARYEVYRNGVTIGTGQLSAATTFKDLSATPNKSYTYQVRAIDTSNNASALSAGLTVRTTKGGRNR